MQRARLCQSPVAAATAQGDFTPSVRNAELIKDFSWVEKTAKEGLLSQVPFVCLATVKTFSWVEKTAGARL
jgi:hypothetical protein